MKKSFVYLSIIATVLIAVIAIFLTKNSWFQDWLAGNLIDTRTPEYIEDGENEQYEAFLAYRVFDSNRTEQWDHPLILAEPRLNFAVKFAEESPRVTNDSDQYPTGIYSLRLDGSDFRTVLSPTQLQQIMKGEVTSNLKKLKRSPNNQYIAFSDSSDTLYLIDLATSTSKTINQKFYGDFYWLDNATILYSSTHKSRGYSLWLYHLESEQQEEITDRFQQTGRIEKFEYYPDFDLGTILLFDGHNDNKPNLHNFKTGGLIAQPPSHHYYGLPTLHPNYRLLNKSKYDYNFKLKNFAFFQQGEPENRVHFQPNVSNVRPSDYAALGIKHIYSATLLNSIKLNDIALPVSLYWVFDQAEEVNAISIAGFTLDFYNKEYCQQSLLYKTHTDEDFDVCQPVASQPTLTAGNRALQSNDLKNSDLKDNGIENSDQLKELDALAKKIDTQIEQNAYINAANSILTLNRQINNLDENSQLKQSLTNANSLLNGKSAHTLSTLVPTAEMCLTIKQDPIHFLVDQVYSNGLGSIIGYSNTEEGQRDRITARLALLVPELVAIGMKPLAQALVKKAKEEGGSRLVSYGKGENTETFMKIFHLVDDKASLNSIYRNIEEEANSKQDKNYRIKHAKQLARFHLFAGNKAKAKQVLVKASGGARVESTLNEDDTVLREAFDPSYTSMRSKQSWITRIKTGRDEVYTNYRLAPYYVEQEYNKLLHNYGNKGIQLAYDLLPLYLESPHLLTQAEELPFLLNVVERFAELKHPQTDVLLKQALEQCKQENCGSSYSYPQMRSLAHLHNIYKHKKNKQQADYYFNKMKDLEEGKVVSLENISLQNRESYFYLALDEKASAKEVIAHLDQYGGNKGVIDTLVRKNRDQPAKHLTYLQERITPLFWNNFSTDDYALFPHILPELTPMTRKDPDIQTSLSNYACGLELSRKYQSIQNTNLV
ncbi:hypothetical protein CBF23_005940 [Marinomonas agarivorans]|nr:hypothetical protein CBF23_005940 [Marinomonas agarivorans]